MKKTAVSILLLAILLASAAACAASVRLPGVGDETRTRWGILRLQGVFILPLGENRIEAWNSCEDSWFDFLDFSSFLEPQTTGGVVGSFEYVLGRRYGIEIAFSYWYEIIELGLEVPAADNLTIKGSPDFILPTLGFNYHLLTDERMDIYAGTMVSLGVIGTGMGTSIDISKDFTFGLNLGMDYYVKGSWSLGASMKYIDFGEMDFSLLPSGVKGIVCNNGLIGIGHLNTLSVTGGIGYRF